MEYIAHEKGVGWQQPMPKYNGSEKMDILRGDFEDFDHTHYSDCEDQSICGECAEVQGA